MRYYFLPAIVSIGIAVGWTTAAAAQVTLVGTVQENETDRPIAGVQVEILDRYDRRLAVRQTDADGRFHVQVRSLEGYRLRATRIGYRETTTPVLWTEGYDQIHVDLRLDADAVLLAPLEVVARSRPTASPVLESFWHRQRSGFGHYFTDADIARRNPGQVTDLIASVPGVHLESSGRGSQRVIYMSRGTRTCPAQIYVDGFLLNRTSRAGMDFGFTLDDAVSPLAVVGIEVYRGLSGVPAEFLSPDAECGVVVVWTRRGGQGPRTPTAPADTTSPSPEPGNAAPDGRAR